MAAPDDSAPNLSGAPAGAGRPTGTPDPASVRAPDSRYREVGLLGAGGMGLVHAVHDDQLGRQVARKRPRDEVPAAASAVRREARLTALLEHPGIVPVYDAGHDAEGRPWYTMRLIRGRTLREVIRQAESPEQRLALLRSVLAAVQAVAYAHARGVVHCDLKSANILLGEHGEVQVIDWGLAARSPVAGGGGTPSSMAPEQLRGEPATPRSDVWSLGLVLHEVLRGAGGNGEPSPGSPQPVKPNGVAPDLGALELPVDLRAILQRCLHQDPAHRYDDAGGLARDLERFLDGRLVEAHTYTASELLLRWLHRYRLVVGVVAIAAGLLIVVGVAAAIRVVAERDAALAAEQVALDARRQSDANLGRALVLSARAAAARLARPEAEVLAARSLVLGESAEARGVLAFFGGSPRVTSSAAPVPACDGRLISGPDDFAVCLSRYSAVIFKGMRPLREVADDVEGVAFAGRVLVIARHKGNAQLIDPETGAILQVEVQLPSSRYLRSGARFAVGPIGALLVVIDAERLTAEAHHPCGEASVIEPAELPDGRLVMGCSEWDLVVYDPRSRTSTSLPDPIPARRAAYRAIVARADGTIAVGTQAGELGLLHPDGRAAHILLGESISGLAWSPDGTRLLVEQGQLGPLVLDGDTIVPIVRLPGTAGTLIRVASDGGFELSGGGGRRWYTQEVRPAQLGRGPGIAALWVDDEGHPWTGRGDATVARLDPRTGGLRATEPLSKTPIKALAPPITGGGVVALAAVGELWPVSAGLLPGAALSDVGGRRVVQLGSSWLLLTYDDYQLVIHPDGRDPERVDLGGRSWVDIATAPDGQKAAALGEEGSIWVIDDADPHRGRLVGSHPGATAVARLSDGRVVLAGGGALTFLEPGGAERVVPHPPIAVLDLAASPDDRWVATGGRDGLTRVVDVQSGALVAVLEGHRERIAAVAWSSPTTLWTASWDGTVRRWDLGVIDEDPRALAAEAEEAWGMTVDQALAASATPR